MMKKLLACVLLIAMFCLPMVAHAEEVDPDWDMSVPTEITEEVQTLFDEAMEQLVGVNYTPVAVLGVKDNVWCILCKATVVYPNAKPYNALVYINAEAKEIQNIYELWIDKHSEKEISAYADGTSNCA